MEIFWYSFDSGAVRNVFNHLPADTVVGFNTVFERKMDTMEIRRCIHAAKLVVLSPSSFERQTDITLLEEVGRADVPCVLVADSHGNILRNCLKNFAPRAYCVVASPVDVDPAEVFGYKEVFYCGGPPAWNQWYDTQPVVLPREKNEVLVLVSGLKQAHTTNHVLKHAISAMNKYGQKWRLIFAPHRREERDFFAEGERTRILNGVETYTPEDIPIEVLTASVDLVITSGHSTVAITAAHQRKRVICFTDGVIQRHNQHQQVGKFIPVKAGAVLGANQLDFHNKIKLILTEGGFADLRKKQEKLYPGKSETNPGIALIEQLKKLAV